MVMCNGSSCVELGTLYQEYVACALKGYVSIDSPEAGYHCNTWSLMQHRALHGVIRRCERSTSRPLRSTPLFVSRCDERCGVQLTSTQEHPLAMPSGCSLSPPVHVPDLQQQGFCIHIPCRVDKARGAHDGGTAAQSDRRQKGAMATLSDIEAGKSPVNDVD
jgi:hypothetical protein